MSHKKVFRDLKVGERSPARTLLRSWSTDNPRKSAADLVSYKSVVMTFICLAFGLTLYYSLTDVGLVHLDGLGTNELV